MIKHIGRQSFSIFHFAFFSDRRRHPDSASFILSALWEIGGRGKLGKFGMRVRGREFGFRGGGGRVCKWALWVY
jgi:hypothetical protein